MKLIFISGPYRGENAWEVEQNIRRAEELALEVAKMGGMPICVHTQSRYYQGVLSEVQWLEGDLELLGRCDAMLVLKDHCLSMGTQGEIDYAEEIDMPIFYQELDNWYEDLLLFISQEDEDEDEIEDDISNYTYSVQEILEHYTVGDLLYVDKEGLLRKLGVIAEPVMLDEEGEKDEDGV